MLAPVKKQICKAYIYIYVKECYKTKQKIKFIKAKKS